MAFPGGPGGMPGMPGMNPNAGMSEQEQQMIKFMQASMESCVGKTVMAGVMGGGLGAMFGLFMASMRYDTPMGQPPMPMPPNATPTTTPNAAGVKPTIPTSTVSSATSTLNASSTPTTSAPALRAPVGSIMYNPISPTADLPLRQQLKIGLRDMYRSSLSSGRNFALVGSIFSGTECTIEGLRAKNDIWNGVAGGCITGGVLARKAGPQAVAVGCLGFAGFSAAIDAYMRMPEDERSRPIG